MHVLLGLASLAWAAPVQCDPAAASTVVAEARIDEQRLPATFPWLVPGLARASADADPALRGALESLCAEGGELTVETGEQWETAGWSAYTLMLTRSVTTGCALRQSTIAISVGVPRDGRPTYHLRGTLPDALTPIGACEEAPRYREEAVLAGEGEPVRLVLVQDRAGDARVHSQVVVRRATENGWTEQALVDPAPPRLLDGGSGPRFVLAHPPGETWVVATEDRELSDGVCAARPGQRVWTWDGVRWVGHDDRDALTLLASAGLWRLAGQEGWLLVLAQDDEDDQELLDARRRRLERRQPDEPLLTLRSSEFPELNPGFLVVTPAPFTDAASAEQVERPWGGRTTSYVKRAWPAADGCAEPAPAP